MVEHTLKAFGEELELLSADLARMGGLAEAMLTDALSAIVRRDSALAETVIARDHKVDELHRDIERRVMRIVALRQPLARDLRETFGALKISTDIERIGDLAKNIAKRAVILHGSDPISITRSVDRMGRIVLGQLAHVLDSYSTRVVDTARSVWTQDEEVDEHYNALFRELLTYMMGDPRMITPCAHLLFIAKNLERIGDHCTNIAENVHFLVTGLELPNDRPKANRLESDS